MKKSFVIPLLLAQTASDRGKGFRFPRGRNNGKAVEAGYPLKDQYVRQAVKAAAQSGVLVSKGYDARLEMSIVYFDVPGFGQVSFHSFLDWQSLGIASAPDGVWCGIRGESRRVCRRLNKKFRLQHYK